MKYRPITLSLLLHAVALFFVAVYVSFPTQKPLKKVYEIPLKAHKPLSKSSSHRSPAFMNPKPTFSKTKPTSSPFLSPSLKTPGSFNASHSSEKETLVSRNTSQTSSQGPDFITSNRSTSLPNPAPPSILWTWDHQIQPSYPEKARDYNMQGTVLIKARILPNGIIHSISIGKSSGHPLLDQEALRTIKQWSFPDQPQDIIYEIPITFSLNDPE